MNVFLMKDKAKSTGKLPFAEHF